jgi:penicillin-binding protein 1A
LTAHDEDTTQPVSPSDPTVVAPATTVIMGDTPFWRRRLVRWMAALAAVGLAAGVAVGAVAWAWFARGLPELPSIDEYRPPIITEMVSADGQVAGEFFVERRKVVPYDRIPRQLIQAFIASEDQRFFHHAGVDWRGTLRAAINTYVLRRKVQGGSSLTQQTAKAILISSEGFQEGTRKSLRRKVRELILAFRLEGAFTKEQILWLYLNGVYLGHHSYGVQAAAENYYRKNVDELTLEEAALLAGLPQAPSKYSPFAHPETAKERRRYVLRRMFEEGMITAAERERASSAEVRVHGVDDVFRETAPFYVEQVRRHVVERYGNERLLKDGLRVEMAMDLEKQRAAQGAMLEGLLAVDRRQGYYGALLRVQGAEREALAARLARSWPAGALAVGDHAVGIVTRVDTAANVVRVAVGANEGILPVAGMRWARRPNPEVGYADALVASVSSVLRTGDVILVRRVTRKELMGAESALASGRAKETPEAEVLLALEQEPRLQGALVSVDPWTGYVAAMVGGYDFEASEFNRAFQACRQPGSAFKPIVYSAAVEKLDFTPATILTDAPIVFRDDESSWKPQNYGEEFKGDVTVRTALINSMNIPAVKTAEALIVKEGSTALADWAKQLGITTPVKQELGSALGSSCVNLWELTNVYALFARYGDRRGSAFVKRVLDREGRVLEDHADWRDPWMPLSERLAAGLAEVSRPREQAMDPRTAYTLVHLMREVATVGTGARAARLGKPAAGKTGTTNDSFDTWFMGFTHDLATGVWLGYDINETPLARGETGGHASLPIWLDYMRDALRDRPQPEFTPPPGMVLVRIDPDTGKPVESGGVVEPFKEGSEPKRDDAAQPKVDAQRLIME